MNQKISIIIFTITALFISSYTVFFTAEAGNIDDISKVRKYIADGAMIVDVRTPAEFSSGNYRGSVNIPLADLEKNINLFGNKDRLIVVYCRTGNRSGKARDILERYGYINVINGGGLKDMPD